MLKKGLSFIASEDYSFGFTALRKIIMIRFSLQGRHVFPAKRAKLCSRRPIEKVDLLLPASCVASSWEPLKKKNASFPTIHVHI